MLLCLLTLIPIASEVAYQVVQFFEGLFPGYFFD